MSKYPLLFSAIQIRGMHLKNRIVMPAIATSYANLDGTTNAKQRAHYLERARGGVGLIIVEGAAIDFPYERAGRRQPSISMRIVSPEWYDLIESVHAFDTKIMIQLTHNGFKASPQNNYGVESVTASQAPHYADAYPARTLELSEIERLIERFASAAGIAASCGFDGVEVHAGHGYLISQFLSPLTNVRTDVYGGSTKNRARFLLDIIRAIRRTCGSRFVIDVRLGVKDEWLTGGLKIEEGVRIAEMCEQVGADLINCTYGFMSDRCSGQTSVWDPRPDYGKQVKQKLKQARVAIVGMLQSAEDCENRLVEGETDLICLGRQLLCDPYWPEKVSMGKDKEIRSCLYCNEGCMKVFLAGGRVRCAINPFIGYEDLYSERLLPQASKKKEVVVVGGGIGGMQVAIALKKRGHNVVLFEREDHLGGQMVLAAIPPHKERIIKALNWFKDEIERLKIDVRLCTVGDVALIRQISPNVVVIATGSDPFVPPIDGMREQKNAWDVLRDAEHAPEKKDIVIIGGGTVGCETAEWLLEKQNRITVIEILDELCAGQEHKYQTYLRCVLYEHGVKVHLNSTVLRVEDTSVFFRNEKGMDETISCDMVITATGQKSGQTGLLNEILEMGIPAYTIGDATIPGNFRYATRSALEIALSI